jgi:hypothetical protein
MPTATKDAAPPAPPETHPHNTAAGDPSPVVATPLILNNGYFEMLGVNLSCLVKHLEAGAAENKPVTVTSFCGEVDYPGVTKYHLRATLYQSFDTGATFDTLNAALSAYNAASTPAAFKARAYASRVPSSNNPIISGLVIPQPFDLLVGDAGATSEVQIDWLLTGPPTVDRGAVAAASAVAGMPGYYAPNGATVPADLTALNAGPLTASPTTAWTTGQYVITGDMLAASWDGTAWVVGKAP